MEQRPWTGKEACTVYSANVWVALPTRPLHTHAHTLGQIHACTNPTVALRQPINRCVVGVGIAHDALVTRSLVDFNFQVKFKKDV